jgi:hypothetical protein
MNDTFASLVFVVGVAMSPGATSSEGRLSLKTKQFDLTPYGHPVAIEAPAGWHLPVILGEDMKPMKLPTRVANVSIQSADNKMGVSISRDAAQVLNVPPLSLEYEMEFIKRDDVSFVRTDNTPGGFIIVYSEKPYSSYSCKLGRTFSVVVYSSTLKELCSSMGKCNSLEDVNHLAAICETLKSAPGGTSKPKTGSP